VEQKVEAVAFKKALSGLVRQELLGVESLEEVPSYELTNTTRVYKSL
jgi:hypothetical protein